ncbi:MAG: ATP-binding cassette domain-containing protein [Gammaproteobacteria bacterium]|nr:ATP-binding cassette domain-containing protein [Gammaproteobacteria bacterium]
MKSINIRFSHVHKRLGRKTILRDECFAIRSGELTLLCGKNGTGKTTLLRIIAGLEKPDIATIDIGNAITSWRRCRKQLRSYSVYLHQHAYMLDGSVKDNLNYTLSQRKLTKMKKIT